MCGHVIIAEFVYVDPDYYVPRSSDYESSAPEKVHIIKKHDKFICSVCKKSFSHYRTCRSHTHVHLGNTTCHTCGKTFNYRHHLYEHMKVHMAKTKCSKCNKAFSTIHNLMRHIQSIHKNVKTDTKPESKT
jgi:hypothetical protein